MAKKKKEAQSLLAGIADEMSKKFKKSGLNIVKGLGDDDVTKVSHWVSSGCKLLDLAISNLPNGGYPSGRMTVLYGPEQSGKSLLALTAIAETQKMGGYGIYIDTERALHEGFAKAIGIQNENFVHIPENRLEQILQLIENLVIGIREKDANIPITLVLDSLAGCVTSKDEDSAYEITGYNTSKSILFSTGLGRLISIINDMNVCFIATNQVKYNMNAGPFESKWRQPHGQSIPHYASVMVMCQKAKNIKAEINGLGRSIGRNISCKVTKNRLGPPETSITMKLYYDRGIDDYESWVDYLKKFGIIKSSGAYYKYDWVDKDTGEVVEYQALGAKGFANEVIAQHPEVRDELWNGVCDNFILAYSVRSDDIDVKDITVTDD